MSLLSFFLAYARGSDGHQNVLWSISYSRVVREQVKSKKPGVFQYPFCQLLTDKNCCSIIGKKTNNKQRPKNNKSHKSNHVADFQKVQEESLGLCSLVNQ